jgi:DNA-binding transcriptional ArsR family regulator
MEISNANETRICNILPLLNEKQRRLFLANEAKALGYGGVSQIQRLTGVSRVTITQGIKEIAAKGYVPEEITRSRKEGGGRKLVEEKDPEIIKLLKELVEPYIKGDPERLLTWVSKSLRHLETAMAQLGKTVSDTTIGEILEMVLGYSLQANKKDLAVSVGHTDRNAQFLYINNMAKLYMRIGQPVLSVDAKKKENIGNFKNNGREYSQKRSPKLVLDHDFPIVENGKATPYGVFDVLKKAYSLAYRHQFHLARLHT